tara:strand:+ start:708 stop:1721 length:1014 start_codon:yes stop_codon:yes gene_type:complete
MDKIKNKLENVSINELDGNETETDEGTKETNETDEGTQETNETDDNYTETFNKFIYSGSISFLIILITFVITVNVLSVGFYHHKSKNITIINDVESILTNSTSAFTASEIKEHIFTDTYKNLLTWQQNTNKVGSFVYRLVNCIFPPLTIVIYFFIFCILQFYTFFKGNWVTLINAIEVDISSVVFIILLTILFITSVPLFYLLLSKIINVSTVSSVLLTILYFIVFSSLPFTGLSSFYTFIMIFFNSYNKTNKLFFNISPLIYLFLIYILITFCSISLAQNPPYGVKIASSVIIGLLVLILSLIVIANLMKTFKPDLFTNWVLKYFKTFVTIPEFET